MRPVALTRGAELLAVKVAAATACEVARRIGKTEATVRHLVHGRRVPAQELRELIAKFWNVPEAAWDQPPFGKPTTNGSGRVCASPTAPSRTVARKFPPGTVAKATSALADLESTVGRLDAALSAVEVDPAASPGHRAQLFNAKVNALEKLCRLRGEGEINEATILRSSAFRRIMSVVATSLRDHPAAAAAMRQALEALREVGA